MAVALYTWPLLEVRPCSVGDVSKLTVLGTQYPGVPRVIAGPPETYTPSLPQKGAGHELLGEQFLIRATQRTLQLKSPLEPQPPDWQ